MQYWPTEGCLRYGKYIVTKIDEETLDDHTQKVFKLRCHGVRTGTTVDLTTTDFYIHQSNRVHYSFYCFKNCCWLLCSTEQLI